MLIPVLLAMYFDAVVVFVTSQTLLFRLALAILCVPDNLCTKQGNQKESLQFLGLKPAVYNQERVQIKSGL